MSSVYNMTDPTLKLKFVVEVDQIEQNSQTAESPSYSTRKLIRLLDQQEMKTVI